MSVERVVNDSRPEVTREQFKELRARFSGKLTLEGAMEVLRAACDDKAVPPIVRLHTATAILDLKMGRSVQSAMARLRRTTGLNPQKLKSSER